MVGVDELELSEFASVVADANGPSLTSIEPEVGGCCCCFTASPLTRFLYEKV